MLYIKYSLISKGEKMTKELQKRVDEFVDKNLPWWEKDESYNSCDGIGAKDIYDAIKFYAEEGNKEHENLLDDLIIEAYKEVLDKDKAFFDDADTGYAPDSMVEGWGDVYLCKGWRCKELDGDKAAELEDDAYYLADCRSCLDEDRYIKVSR